MKHIPLLLVLGVLLSGVAKAAPEPKANCELRMVSNASAGGAGGEVFMAIFTRNKEECLAKADPSVEAKFRSPSGTSAKRGGAGPQP